MQRITGIFVIAGAIAALVLALAPVAATEATTFQSIINLPNG